MRPEITPVIRAEVLQFASGMTADVASPAIVLLNAALLTQWLEVAADDGDLEVRLNALRRQHLNTSRGLQEGTWELAADPNPWLDGARAYYQYLTAGRPGGEAK